jgi:hypothetical protein
MGIAGLLLAGAYWGRGGRASAQEDVSNRRSGPHSRSHAFNTAQRLQVVMIVAHSSSTRQQPDAC